MTDAVGNELRADFDLRSYQPASVTDPSGGITAAAFDPLARLVSVIRPCDSAAAPTQTISYDTSAVPIVVAATTATTPGGPRRSERQFVDGGGRIVQQRVTGETGEIAAATTTYGCVASLPARTRPSARAMRPTARLRLTSRTPRSPMTPSVACSRRCARTVRSRRSGMCRA